MATFKLVADVEFEAESLDDAAFKLINHFMAVGNIQSWEVDIHGKQEFLDLTGEISLRKES